jgi:TatD DNase family protein
VEFVDSHCHLDDEQFDSDRVAAVQRAREAGLKHLLAIGTGNGPPDLEAAVRLAEQYDFIEATVGVHPNDAEKVDSNTFDHLRCSLEHPKVRAVGEIGLDFYWDVPRHVQLPVFYRQLELAEEHGMPIVIHTRDAWDDTIATLKERWVPSRLPCVLHCFTGDAALAEQCLELGFFLAFGGVTTFPKSVPIREAARLTPMDRMLVETDSPYLAPIPFRGKRNEPAYVLHTAKVISDLRQVPLDELGRQTTTNFEQIFLGKLRQPVGYTEGSQRQDNV